MGHERVSPTGCLWAVAEMSLRETRRSGFDMRNNYTGFKPKTFHCNESRGLRERMNRSLFVAGWSYQQLLNSLLLLLPLYWLLVHHLAIMIVYCDTRSDSCIYAYSKLRTTLGSMHARMYIHCAWYSGDDKWIWHWGNLNIWWCVMKWSAVRHKLILYSYGFC